MLPQLPPELWYMILKRKTEIEKPRMSKIETRIKFMIEGMLELPENSGRVHFRWAKRGTIKHETMIDIIVDGYPTFTKQIICPRCRVNYFDPYNCQTRHLIIYALY